MPIASTVSLFFGALLLCFYCQVISAELRSSKNWGLTVEGTEVVEKGSHEARVFNCISSEGFPHSDLMVCMHTQI